MSNVYSKLDQIPSGTAQGGLTSGCLVLEGGALRTMYSQGVLDAWMQNQLQFYRCEFPEKSTCADQTGLPAEGLQPDRTVKCQEFL